MNEEIKIIQIKMEMLKFCIEEHMGYMLTNMDFSWFVDKATKKIVLRMNKRILATEMGRFEKEIICPLNWVEAVKLRFFPKWLLKICPVKYHREIIKWIQYATFPKCKMEFPPNLGEVVFKVMDKSRNDIVRRIL